jgi:hypothetical protein
MNKFRHILVSFSLFVLCFGLYFPAHATVLATVVPAGGTQFNIAYHISNDSGQIVEELTIYFDSQHFRNLQLLSSPSGWDVISIQPDTGLPAPGFVDLLALTAPLQWGEVLDDLVVTATFLGQNTPGSQYYEIIDPNSFSVLESGYTVVAVPPTDLNSPATLWLIVTGILGLIATRSRPSWVPTA